MQVSFSLLGPDTAVPSSYKFCNSMHYSRKTICHTIPEKNDYDKSDQKKSIEIKLAARTRISSEKK